MRTLGVGPSTESPTGPVERRIFSRGPVQRRVSVWGHATAQGDHPTQIPCLSIRTGTKHSLVGGPCIRALALAVAMTTCQARVDAQDTMNGASFVAGSSAHVSYGSTDARTDTAPVLARGADADAPISVTGKSGALVINATFDGSITSDVNSAAIQAVINDAIAICESLFNDAITVSIRFRYATTEADGTTPLPGGALAISETCLYQVPWNTYINALTADATTANDATANASLPGAPSSTNVLPSSADGRSVALATPGCLNANGTLGGTYDGIVTLNSSQSFKFTRPPAASFYDALRATEHEMDEVLGLGSFIGAFVDLRPQDLFSWSAAGVRNLTSSGTRYFSIDGGTTNLVGFNQNTSGDFGDWLSGSCPQTTPYVQNAFSCDNQVSDVTTTSPEGINLDVVGYDLITGPPTPTPTVPPFATCAATPIGGCDGPGKGSVLVKNDTDNSKDKLLWKWLKGPLMTQGDFGNPDTGTTRYTLCVYDDNNVEESIAIPQVTNWSPVSTKGYQYKDAGGSVFGVTEILFKGGGAGQSKILVKGKGGNLPQPTLPFSQSINVTVQLLRNDSSQCWETVFVPQATKSSGTQFKDKF